MKTETRNPKSEPENPLVSLDAELDRSVVTFALVLAASAVIAGLGVWKFIELICGLFAS